ncbi:MAG: hypothetical protein ABEH90_01795 [Halolamina sp.]
MVDPIFTYIGGIAFLVLIIGSMLYLTFSTLDIEEDDKNPGESVVGGVGQDEEPEPADDNSEDEPERIEKAETDQEETTEDISIGEGVEPDDGDEDEDTDGDEDEDTDGDEDEDTDGTGETT